MDLYIVLRFDKFESYAGVFGLLNGGGFDDVMELVVAA